MGNETLIVAAAESHIYRLNRAGVLEDAWEAHHPHLPTDLDKPAFFRGSTMGGGALWLVDR